MSKQRAPSDLILCTAWWTQASVLQSQSLLCPAANCRAKPDCQTGSRLQKPRPGCPVLSLLANNWRATGGSSTWSHTAAQPGWGQSTTTVPRLTPTECRQRLCSFLSALRMKHPSELLHFWEGATAVVPPSSPVPGLHPACGTAARSCTQKGQALWDTWSTSYLQQQKEDSTSGTRSSSQGYISENESLSAQVVSSP